MFISSASVGALDLSGVLTHLEMETLPDGTLPYATSAGAKYSAARRDLSLHH